MLWLDMSWVLDLTYIFKPHISLFIVIFSTLTSFHHYFSTSHITTYYTHLLFFLHHYLLDTILVSLEWWFFTHHYMEGSHILPPVHLMGGGSEILFWEVVLLVRIHVTSVHGESLFIWLCISWEVIHYWSECAQKNKIKKNRRWRIFHCIILH